MGQTYSSFVHSVKTFVSDVLNLVNGIRIPNYINEANQ